MPVKNGKSCVLHEHIIVFADKNITCEKKLKILNLISIDVYFSLWDILSVDRYFKYFSMWLIKHILKKISHQTYFKKNKK